MCARGKGLTSDQKEKNILKLNNEGKTGSVMGKYLGINRLYFYSV